MKKLFSVSICVMLAAVLLLGLAGIAAARKKACEKYTYKCECEQAG